MMAYHAHSGWYFERFDDGVGVSQKDSHGDPMFTVWFDKNTWASIVASVSARGENGETFAEALAFHTPPSERTTE